jgi:acyl-CoA hydrolase
MKDPNRCKTITMAEVMPPEKANFTGHIHGGYIVMLLDRVAYACAARYCSKDVVTLSIDQVLFKEPIFIGELVSFYATINYVGHTSMEVGIKVTAENLKTGDVRHTNTSYLTMVAIDENGKSCEVPPLKLENDIEKRRFSESEHRKKLRFEFQEKHKSIKDSKE